MILTNYDSLAETHMADNPGEVNGGDEYQDTVPFDDTIVLESPTVESQMVNLHADTEILDIDIDKEVVLDSDDEGLQNAEMVSQMNKPPEKTDRSLGVDRVISGIKLLNPETSHSYVGYFRRRSSKERSCSAHKESDSGPDSTNVETTTWQKQHNTKDYENRVECQVAVCGNVKEGALNNTKCDCDGKIIASVDDMEDTDMVSKASRADAEVEREVPLSKYEAIDGKKDTLLATDGHDHLTYIDSQEPGEASQAYALSIVDQYLSVTDVKFSPKVERGKGTRVASPPSLFGKGPQALARKASLRTTYGQSESFDWSDKDAVDQAGSFIRKKKDIVSDCKDYGQGSVSMCQHVKNLNFKTDDDFGVAKMQGTIAHGENKDLTQTLNIYKNSEMVQTATMRTDINSIQQLDEKAGLESLGEQLDEEVMERDGPEMFDVGFDTQMAAEAMEALLNDPPPDSNMNGPQALENLLENPFEGCILTGASKCSSSLASDVSEVIVKKQRKMTQSCKKISKNNFCSSTDANETKLDANLTRRKKEISQTPLLAERVKNINEVSMDLLSSKSVRCDLHTGKCRGKFKRSSHIARSTWSSSLVHCQQSIEDPPCTSGERLNCIVKEVDVFKRGRTRSRLHSDDFDVLAVRNKSPKIVSNTHSDARNDNSKKQIQTEASVAATMSHSGLDFSTYPKRKRTHREAPHRFRRESDRCASSTLMHSKIGSSQSVGTLQKSEANSNAPHLGLHAVRKPRSVRQLQPSLNNKPVECSVTPNLCVPKLIDVHCDSVVIREQMNRIDSIAVNALCQSGKFDDACDKVSADGARKNLKFDELPNAHLSALPAYMVAENGKPLLKRSSSRSILTKELTRLGFAESLPEFASKDLRRRRNMANVQVLFSQSLDDCIRKQQKKILSRLGISIATCCSEATHFITDRFVRTRNMLEAIALGKPVVTHLWLEACAQGNCLVDEKKYILRDAKKEKEIGFDLSVSLSRARQHPLLKNRRIFITQNVKPCKEMVEILVMAVNGQLVEKVQRAAIRDKSILKDLLILSCEEDFATCEPFIKEGLPIYNSELLLNGIVTQRLDYVRHQLFTNNVKNNCAVFFSRRAKRQR